jgi:LPXTG-motif cell wall-anchored protein
VLLDNLPDSFVAASIALVADELPKTGVKISMIAFGGLTLLILGGGLFLASRRRRHAANRTYPASLPRAGFKQGPAGHALGEGGETSRPSSIPEA